MTTPFRGWMLANIPISNEAPHPGSQRGLFQIFIDPDLNYGHFVRALGTRWIKVGFVRITEETQDSLIFELTSFPYLETAYELPDGAAGADDFLVTFSTIFQPNQTDRRRGTWTDSSGDTGEWDSFSPSVSSRPATRTIETWRDFKAWIDSVDDRNAIYRGVSHASYTLRSSFHRTGRVDIVRFRDDFARFTNEAEGVALRQREPLISTDLAVNLAIAQHYGFPTPFLDCTESPYIAAYFALVHWIAPPSATDRTVNYARVFRIPGTLVNRLNTPAKLLALEPSIWVINPRASGNLRFTAQKGRFLYANIPVMESILSEYEGRNAEDAVEYVDVSVNCAIAALRDLDLMAINPASLFPGLEGVAKALKHKLFLLG